jgi:hypothetical protein
LGYLVELRWDAADVVDVKFNDGVPANGELVWTDRNVTLSWTAAGVPGVDSGQIGVQPQAPAPAVVWNSDAVPPVQVQVVARGIAQPLSGRYRRRATEVVRWQLAPVNPSNDRWLVHPGAMTGDLWHIVAAMRIDPALRLVVCWNRANRRDNQQAEALLTLVDRLGLNSDGRVLRESQNGQPEASIGNMQARELGAARIAATTSRHNKGDVLVGHTWASTSVLVQAVAANRYDPGPVQQQLRTLFEAANQGSESFTKFRETFDAYALDGWLPGLVPGTHYVLVNMRWTGQHGQNPQHNITEGRFRQIVEMAARHTTNNRPTQVIRIGRPELFDPGAFGWLEAAGTQAVDIYSDDPHHAPAGLAQEISSNKLFQPYFWQRVVAAATAGAQVSLIGGRSGGMDIASFMGIRSASWDTPSPADQHYMRLHWAAPFNTIIQDNAGLLDDAALSSWMLGRDLVPLLDGDPVTSAVVGNLPAYASDRAAFEALWYPRR